MQHKQIQQKSQRTTHKSLLNRCTFFGLGVWCLAIADSAWAGGGGTGGGVRTVSVTAVPIGALLTAQLALWLWYVWSGRK